MRKEKEECLNEEEEEQDKKVRLEGQNPEQNIFTNTHTKNENKEIRFVFSNLMISIIYNTILYCTSIFSQCLGINSISRFRLNIFIGYC